jgi:hypothetical protein
MKEFSMREFNMKVFSMRVFNKREFNKYERIYLLTMKEFNNRVIENDIECRFRLKRI